jgi:hypothetical protein
VIAARSFRDGAPPSNPAAAFSRASSSAAPERDHQVVERDTGALAAQERGQESAIPLRRPEHLVHDVRLRISVAQLREARGGRLEEIARRPQAEPENALVVPDVLEVAAHVAEQAKDVELLVRLHGTAKWYHAETRPTRDPLLPGDGSASASCGLMARRPC